jgi:hypothetical protein
MDLEQTQTILQKALALDAKRAISENYVAIFSLKIELFWLSVK